MKNRNAYYNMNYPNRGIAVIINNHTFHDGEVRNGSEKDVYAMYNALKKLDFEVDVYNSCTAEEMTNIMTNYGRKDHKDNACFVAVIMSHGEEKSVIQAADKRWLKLCDLTDPIKRAQSLIGKPKIFFIQACRGSIEMDNAVVNIKRDNAEKVVDPMRANPTSVRQAPDLPIEIDVFTHYATVSGYVSYRDEKLGSWFIQSLASNLIEYANEVDLCEIARYVINDVCNRSDPTCEQVPLFHSTLRFKMMFPSTKQKDTTHFETTGLCNPDGVVYIGQTVDGKKSGEGIVKWPNGDLYEGGWINDQRSGKGVMKWRNGDIYNGNWVADQRSGKGVMTWADGNEYNGDWENDQRSGQGFMTWQNGDIYNGFWVNDELNGKGNFKWSNSDRYNGHWENGMRHGKGDMKWSNGDQFKGHWANGMRHGKGDMKWSNRDQFKGDWIDDLRNGKGVMTWQYGEKYDGEWINGQRNGHGVMTWRNGEKYDGEWVADQRSGKGVYNWPDGDRYKGKFLNGLKHGEGTYFFSEGHFHKGDWANDQRNGKGTINWPNGNRYEGSWINDEPIAKNFLQKCLNYIFS